MSGRGNRIITDNKVSLGNNKDSFLIIINCLSSTFNKYH